MVAGRGVLAQVEEGVGRGVVGVSLENRIITWLNQCKDLGAELTRVPKISATVSDPVQGLQRVSKVVPTPELTSQLLSSGADFTHLRCGEAFGGVRGAISAVCTLSSRRSRSSVGGSFSIIARDLVR